MKIKGKIWYISLKFTFLFLISIALDYVILKFLTILFGDPNLIGYFNSVFNTLIVGIVPIFVLYVQIITNHTQFAYNQKYNEFSTIVDLSIKYLNLYNIDTLKQLLLEWQYGYESNEILSRELSRLKDNATKVWLEFSFKINPEDKISTEFIANQKSNYNILCRIFEDLGSLLCNSYAELKDIHSKEYNLLLKSGSRLSYCLNEKSLVKAFFEDYDISYSKVQNEINTYLNSLKTNLNSTINIYEELKNEKL